jgi:PadR family transcriptional regulator, regulatory protein PadR
MTRQTELLKGTLDLLILRSLELEQRYRLGDRGAHRAGHARNIRCQAGFVVPALHRLEQQGFIEGEWTTSPAGRRARSYRPPAAGKRQLTAGKKEWSRIAPAVGRMLEEKGWPWQPAESVVYGSFLPSRPC